MHILTGIRTCDPCMQVVIAMAAQYFPLLTHVCSTEFSTCHVSSVDFEWPLFLSSVPTEQLQ
jgi:hypothetical protein